MHNSWQHPWFDYSQAPLLVQRYPQKTTDEDMTSFVHAVESYYSAHPDHFACVCDLGNTAFVSATQRKIMSEFDKRVAEHDRRFCVGTALVVPNRAMRGIIIAIFWLSPPVYPYKFFSNLEDGEKWVRERLEEKKLSPHR